MIIIDILLLFILANFNPHSNFLLYYYYLHPLHYKFPTNIHLHLPLNLLIIILKFESLFINAIDQLIELLHPRNNCKTFLMFRLEIMVINELY